MSTFYLLLFCLLCSGQLILRDIKHLGLRDLFYEDGVESKEGNP